MKSMKFLVALALLLSAGSGHAEPVNFENFGIGVGKPGDATRFAPGTGEIVTGQGAGEDTPAAAPVMLAATPASQIVGHPDELKFVKLEYTPPKPGDAWGANFYRFLPDGAAWSPTYGGFHSPARFGTLRFAAD